MNLERAVKRVWWHPIGQGAVVLLITAMGAWLRFAAIDRFPPGLYRDEAYNGLDALQVLKIVQQGSWPASLLELPVFFEANHGREPLFIYLLALSISIWGRSPGALRVVSAFLGSLTVPAIYWLARELFDHTVGVVAAVLVATTIWTLNLSRVAFRAVAMVPLLAVALALLWRGLFNKRPGFMVAAGLAYGLSFYTYLATRMTVVALLLFIVYMVALHRESRWLGGWALLVLAAAVIAAPLVGYFIGHREVLLERVAQVSLFHPDIHGGNLGLALVRHAGRTLAAFFWRGDSIPRHNVPLRPVFTPPIAVAFVGGILLSLRRILRPAHALLLIWLAVLSLPTLLAEDAPHFLRGSGVLPLLFCAPALGLVTWARRPILGRWWLGPITALVALGVGAALDLAAYARHMRSEAAYYQFESGAVELAAEINSFRRVGWRGEGLSVPAAVPHADRRVYIAARLWRDWPSLRYLSPKGEDLVPLEGGASTAQPPAVRVFLALWPFEQDLRALALLPPESMIRVREGARERGDLEAESRLLYVIYQAEPAGEWSQRQPLGEWAAGIRLLGYRLRPLPDGRLAIVLYWQATRAVEIDYNVFCHVLLDGTWAGQSDGPAAGGYYPTSRWRAGDVVEDVHIAPVKIDVGQKLGVRVGLYRWETMERLPFVEGAGSVEGAYVELE